MSDFVEVKTAELVGPALDWAVANAIEAWEFAHEWFPTMTLDPRFIGISNVAVDGCVWLKPRNPIRQDPQPFRPSTDWAQGGPLLDSMVIGVIHNSRIRPHPFDEGYQAMVSHFIEPSEGHTILIAACRAIVAAKLGDVVKVPKELIND